VEVTSLRRRDRERGFRAETSSGPIEARNVVVATGPYQQPRIPRLFRTERSIVQVHASRYRNPAQLPEGAVLVIGAAASGAQIAEELLLAGRRVYLSVGRHRRAPRRYRGHDLHWWWRAMGLDRIPAENRGPDRSPVVQTGAYGGHTVDFRQFAAQGMVLLGRAEGAEDGIVGFAPDLLEDLGRGDTAYCAFLDAADAYVSREWLDVAEDPDARIATPDPPSLAATLRQLDLRETRVGTVIWATGYGVDFSWIEGLRLDACGVPVTARASPMCRGCTCWVCRSCRT
jgi:putative flavoprotein involved in K+ transport